MQLDCGIRHDRIASWLDDELGLAREGESWAFASGDASCRISAIPLEGRTFAGIEIERTELSAQGDQSAIDAFERLFMLRFASAGG